MGSDHAHHHHHLATENLKTAFFLNLAFTFIEIVGGFLTNSIAILSDAIHDLGDSVSLGLAWFFDSLSKKDATPFLTYGYRRYRLLGGLITGIMLIAGISVVLANAIPRILSPQPVHAPWMMALAVVGILFNGAAVLRVRSGTSLTEKMVSWHLLEDVFGWVAVLLGAAAIAIWDIPIIDPILSIAVSLFILWNVFKNLRKVFAIFLQTVPDGFDTDQFQQDALAIPGVNSLHHVHCWSIDGESHVISAHLVVDAAPDQLPAIKSRVRDLLDPEVFEHVTLEIDDPEIPCPQNLPTVDTTGDHG